MTYYIYACTLTCAKRCNNMEDFKRSLKIGFKGLDVVIVGKGVIHK